MKQLKDYDFLVTMTASYLLQDLEGIEAGYPWINTYLRTHYKQVSSIHQQVILEEMHAALKAMPKSKYKTSLRTLYKELLDHDA